MQHYFINQRAYTLVNDLKTELAFDSAKNYLFDLSYLAILDLIGEKALDFLQGQVTSDLREMQEKALFPGAICNLKGRILALFQACQYQGLQLVLPADLLEDTEKSLMPAAMLSRVKMQKNTEFSLLGFYCQNPSDLCIPEDASFSLYLPERQDATGSFFVVFVNEASKAGMIEPFISNNQYRGSLAWHTLTLLNNAVEIYPNTRAELLPHRLDLHHTDYLNFEKGCYKGQEIIARTQYRATIKHKRDLFITDLQETMQPGQKVMDESGKREIGEIIDLSPISENQMVVAASVLIE